MKQSTLMIQNKSRNTESRLLFTIAYVVILVEKIIGASAISKWEGFGTADKVVSLLVVAMLFLYVVCQEMSTALFWEMTILTTICALSFAGSGRHTEVLVFTAFLISGYFIDKGYIFRVYVITTSLTVLLVLLLFLTGIIERDYVTRNGIVRWYYGFIFTTYVANFYFHIVVAYIFLKKKNINIIETIIILGLNYWIYKTSDTRAVYYLIIGMIAILWLIRLAPKLTKTFLFKIVVFGLYGVLAALIYYLSLNADKYQRLNSKLTNRLQLGNQALKKYGIHLFGTETEWVTGRLGIERTKPYFYVDSSYLNIMLSFGIVMLLLILVSMTSVGIRLYDKRRMNACIAFAFFAVHCFTDPQLIEIKYDPMILLFAESLFYLFYEKKRSVYCSKNIDQMQEQINSIMPFE